MKDMKPRHLANLKSLVLTIMLAGLGPLLGSCSQTSDERTTYSAPSTPPPAEPEIDSAGPAVVASQGVGRGDDRPISKASSTDLSTLSARDVSGANGAGELACVFENEQGSSLLYAAGDVASQKRANGIVKVGTIVKTLSAPGGFDGILNSATFAGEDGTLRVLIGSTTRSNGESPARPATLTYEPANGESRTYSGLWTCGP